MQNSKNRKRIADARRRIKRAARDLKFKDLKSSRHDERVAERVAVAEEMKKKLEALIAEKFKEA